MVAGTLLIMLMVLLPGIIMAVLGVGLMANQLLRSTRLLAALAAIFVLYSMCIKQSYPLKITLLGFGLVFILMLYVLFAARLRRMAFYLLKT